MYVLISAEGTHKPDWHWMVVNKRGLLVDLDRVEDPNKLLDANVLRIAWGPVTRRDGITECGVILLRDRSKPRIFFDRTLLDPYLRAFNDRAFDIAYAQAEYEAANAPAAQ